MKKQKSLMVIIFCLALLFGGASSAKAVIQLIGDELTVTGFVMTQYQLHLGPQNPSLAQVNGGSNFQTSLLRTLWQNEITFKPSDTFRLFAKIRYINDSTSQIDHNLLNYDPFPSTHYPGSGTMLQANDNHNAFQVWELRADLHFSDQFWLRLGKQQVVWGENLIGQRILDFVNPLDNTWSMFWQTDEFENTRIPIWLIRGGYSIPNRFIKNLTLEGIIDPGDVQCSQNPPTGSPLTLFVLPKFIDVTGNDLPRGHPTGGGRISGMIGQVGFQLVYYYKYADSSVSTPYGVMVDPINGIHLGPPPPPPKPWLKFDILEEEHFTPIHNYGGAFNWYCDPAKTVFTGECVYTPDFPYNSSNTNAEWVQKKGTFKWGVNATRPTSILPAGFDYASLVLQYVQTYLEGDKNTILINNGKADKYNATILGSLSQTFLHQQLTAYVRFIYDPDDAHWGQGYLQYAPGDHWRYMVFGNWFGGADKRAASLGSFYWASSMGFQVTFQY